MNVQCLIFWVVVNAYCNNVYGNVDQVKKFNTNDEHQDTTRFSTESVQKPSDIEGILADIFLNQNSENNIFS